MKDTWFCLSCRILVELTQHGRCSHCDGNGVAYGEGLGFFSMNDILDIERLYSANQAPARENA